jgi:hypothetical protein
MGNAVTAGLPTPDWYNLLTAGADPTGTRDSGPALAAAWATGRPVYAPAGTYLINEGVISTAPNFTMRGDGRWQTIFNYAGSGDCMRVYSTSSYQAGGLAGATLEGFLIDGTNAAAGAAGLHFGDIYQGHLDIGVRAFTGAGSIGVHLDNNYFWTEQLTGRIWAERCANHVVFDNSVNTSGSSTGSFDRAILDIFIDQWGTGGGNGIIFQNGAFVIDGHLGFYGNFITQATEYAALTLTGSNTAGFSLIANSVLNIGMENQSATGTPPISINFGTENNPAGDGNSIAYTTGNIDFGAHNAFSEAVNSQFSFQHEGPVIGDSQLLRSQGLGMFPYQFGALTNGQQVPTRFQAMARVAPAANVTGIRLQGFNPDNGQQFTLVNNSAFTITFDVAGTSKVADGTSDVIAALSAAMFIWSVDAALWYRVY